MEAQEVQRLFQECRGTKVGIVARRSGMSHQTLLGLFFEHRLLGNELDDPTPDEIAAATQSLRSSWSEETERSRWVGSRADPHWK